MFQMSRFNRWSFYLHFCDYKDPLAVLCSAVPPNLFTVPASHSFYFLLILTTVKSRLGCATVRLQGCYYYYYSKSLRSLISVTSKAEPHLMREMMTSKTTTKTTAKPKTEAETSRIVRIPIESFSYSNQSDILKVRKKPKKTKKFERLKL